MALHGFVYTPDAKGRILTLLDAFVNTIFPETSGPDIHIGSGAAYSGG